MRSVVLASGSEGNSSFVSIENQNILIDLGKNAKYISDFEQCVSFVKNNVRENDIVLTLGAGTVTRIGPMLTK